jgi:hypothetical protein
VEVDLTAPSDLYVKTRQVPCKTAWLMLSALSASQVVEVIRRRVVSGAYCYGLRCRQRVLRDCSPQQNLLRPQWLAVGQCRRGMDVRCNGDDRRKCGRREANSPSLRRSTSGALWRGPWMPIQIWKPHHVSFFSTLIGRRQPHLSLSPSSFSRQHAASCQLRGKVARLNLFGESSSGGVARPAIEAFASSVASRACPILSKPTRPWPASIVPGLHEQATQRWQIVVVLSPQSMCETAKVTVSDDTKCSADNLSTPPCLNIAGDTLRRMQ